MIEAYPVLDKNLSFQFEVKKSRFITYLVRVEGKDQALAYLQKIKKQHKDARHHCWAWDVVMMESRKARQENR